MYSRCMKKIVEAHHHPLLSEGERLEPGGVLTNNATLIRLVIDAAGAPTAETTPHTRSSIANRVGVRSLACESDRRARLS
jgi:hypothetical protein